MKCPRCGYAMARSIVGGKLPNYLHTCSRCDVIWYIKNVKVKIKASDAIEKADNDTFFTLDF